MFYTYFILTLYHYNVSEFRISNIHEYGRMRFSTKRRTCWLAQHTHMPYH